MGGPKRRRLKCVGPSVEIRSVGLAEVGIRRGVINCPVGSLSPAAYHSRPKKITGIHVPLISPLFYCISASPVNSKVIKSSLSVLV